jgi:hypothetical protein
VVESSAAVRHVEVEVPEASVPCAPPQQISDSFLLPPRRPQPHARSHHLLRDCLHRLRWFQFGEGIDVELATLLGRVFIVAADVVGLGEFQDLVDELVVVWAGRTEGEGPGVKGEIEVGVGGFGEGMVGPPGSVDLGEVGDKRLQVLVKSGVCLRVEEAFNIVGVEENEQEQLLVVVLLEERNGVGGRGEVAQTVLRTL